jgi:hypothetical protein
VFVTDAVGNMVRGAVGVLATEHAPPTGMKHLVRGAGRLVQSAARRREGAQPRAARKRSTNGAKRARSWTRNAWPASG